MFRRAGGPGFSPAIAMLQQERLQPLKFQGLKPQGRALTAGLKPGPPKPFALPLSCGLPIRAEPRTLEMAEIAALAWQEGLMSAFEDHKDELEHYEQMLGAHRGRLAVSLDRVTNAMVLVGQHGVYCHSQRDPGKPTMDIQIITDELRKAKELIQSVMEELRVERENRLRAN